MISIISRLLLLQKADMTGPLTSVRLQPLFYSFRNCEFCPTFINLDPRCSNRQLSYDVCLEVRGEIIRTVLCYCVLKLCTVISTLR